MAHCYQTLTIRELCEKVSSGRWDLNPDWQRGSVWTEKQKPKLIDSIDNDYPIPHITLWTRPHGKAVMVDGKQRTETIVGFINDEFCAAGNDWFSGRSEEAQQAFLDRQIQTLVFQSRIDEGFIVEYFERINSGSKQLRNGELINSLCGKPIVLRITELFFAPGDFRNRWTAVFGEPRTDDKRMKYHEDTVPYLTSSMFGVKFLTKSYPVIAPCLKNTTQGDVDAHMHTFLQGMNAFLNVCQQIFEQCPQMRPGWSKQGLPPLRQLSCVWLTILEPQHVEDPATFWARFYRLMSDNQEIAHRWALHMRKNGKPGQLYEEIQFAIGCLE